MKAVRLTLIATLILGVFFFFAGCGKRDTTPIGTGKVLQFSDVVQAVPQGALPFTPDKGYEVVRSDWLPGFYERWREDIFAKGVTKWEGRFDCNKFASAYVAAAQLEYYRDRFHSWTPSQALAVGEVWYQASSHVRGPHAIVCAITERGPLFIEPQTGAVLTLSAAERSSIFFKRF